MKAKDNEISLKNKHEWQKQTSYHDKKERLNKQNEHRAKQAVKLHSDKETSDKKLICRCEGK